MRLLASAALLAAHLAGAALALTTLLHTWRERLVVKLLLEQILQHLVGALSIPVALAFAWLFVGAAAAVGVASLAQAVRVLRRLSGGEPEPEAALRLRLLLYLALGYVLLSVFVFSSAETASGPFRVRFPVFVEVGATLVFGAWMRWSRRRAVRGPGPARRRRRVLDLVAMNLALALILAEVGLRVVSAVVPMPILVTGASSARIRRDAERLRPGTLRLGFPVNEGGHYDTPFLPRSELQGPLVASIGDSFAYGVVPHAYHFTTVAERALPGVSIYNMGFPGLGPRDYAALLRSTALPLDPDLVVVDLFVGNDIEDSVSAPDDSGWYDADHYRLGLLAYRLATVRKAHRTDWAREADAAHPAPGSPAERYPWLEDPMLERPSIGRDLFLGVETSRAAFVQGDGAYPPFFAALDELVREAEGVPLAFVLIPDEYQVEDGLWDDMVSRAGHPMDRDRVQRETLAWLGSRGLPCLDLLPALRAVPPMADGRRHLYHLQDTHFNARGNEVAGRALARFLAPLLAREARQVAEPLPLVLDLGSDAQRAWLRRGWQDRESDHVWSDGPESLLLAPIGGSTDVVMTLDCLSLSVPGLPEQRIRVTLNGIDVGEVVLREGRNRYALTLPGRLLRPARNAIAFRYAWTRRPVDVLPGSEDSRELAVAWYGIRFAEGNADAASPKHP